MGGDDYYWEILPTFLSSHIEPNGNKIIIINHVNYNLLSWSYIQNFCGPPPPNFLGMGTSNSIFWMPIVVLREWSKNWIFIRSGFHYGSFYLNLHIYEEVFTWSLGKKLGLAISRTRSKKLQQNYHFSLLLFCIYINLINY